MDPATASILGQAAASFGKEFGKGAANRIFGGPGSNDLRNINKLLSQILGELKVIQQKLDHIIGAVDALPGFIVNQEVDSAYRFLESAYVQGASEVGSLSVPEEKLRDPLHAWMTVVDLETRPKELLVLPFWTEFVRSRLPLVTDKVFSERLSEKKEKWDSMVTADLQATDKAFAEARKILISHVFKKSSVVVTGETPYFSYELTKDPSISVSGPFGGSISLPDQRFIQKKANHEKRLKELRVVIDAKRVDFINHYTFQQLMEIYLPTLNRRGSLPEPESPPEAALSLEA